MKIEPVYLLLGPEHGEKALFVRKLKQEVKNQSAGSFEEYRFYPFETEIQQIVGILRNGSLFSEFKIVTLYQVETITKKVEIETILHYLRQPPRDAVLLLISDDVRIDNRLKSKLPKESVKIFWEMFENKKQDWVSSFFSKYGKQIQPEAADVILELVENNTLDLQRECRRLMLHYEEKQIIGPADVEAFLYHSKEENVFTLFDKIVKKDFEGSLEIAEKLALSGETNSIQLLGGLLWQFKRLQLINYYLQNHFGFDEACKKCGIKSKKAQSSYQGALENYPGDSVNNIIRLISRYDYLVREAKSETETIVFSLFLYCCIKKNGAYNLL
jgi:DNA polymerase III subunit delta